MTNARGVAKTKILELIHRFVTAVPKSAPSEFTAGLTARMLCQLFKDPYNYRSYFDLWQDHGFHITPNHFYYAIPDTTALRDDLWDKASELAGIDLNEDTQLHLLRSVFPQFSGDHSEYPMEPTGVPHQSCFNNPKSSGTDAGVLYCMVRHSEPRTVSGTSYRLRA